MRMKTLSRLVAVTMAVVLLAPAAEANMGVPIIGVTLPGMVIALLPIIAVETYVLIERLGLSLWKSVELASVGNLASTIIGLPVTWLILALLLSTATGGVARDISTARGKFLTVTLDAPWIAPYETKDMHWMVPAACLTMLVPFFFASWLIEYEVGLWFVDRGKASGLSDAVLIGNLITYGIIAGLVGLVTLLEYRSSRKAGRTVTRPGWSDPAEAERFIRQSLREVQLELNRRGAASDLGEDHEDSEAKRERLRMVRSRQPERANQVGAMFHMPTNNSLSVGENCELR
jgi:hypothetical protein